MWWDILSYIWECVKDSWSLSWKSLNGKWGTIVTAVVFVLPIYNWLKQHLSFLGPDMADIVTTILLIAMAFVIALFFALLVNAIFVAPFRLWRKSKKKVSDHMSLIDAIFHVSEETEYGRGKERVGLYEEIKKLASGGTIRMEGMLKKPLYDKADTCFSVIPSDFLDSCEYGEHGDFGVPSLVEIVPRSPDDDKWQDRGLGFLSGLRQERRQRIYYYPRVLVKDIKRHFDDRRV